MMSRRASKQRLVNMKDDVQLAGDGTGPLLQRDYWAVIRGCRINPAEVIQVVCKQFAEFAPKDLVRFTSGADLDRPICVGSIMNVKIRMVTEARVRVVHQDDCSITFATLSGHPEAGKITFGAYRNGTGDVIFHIRSRARAASAANLAGFLIAGDPMQTNTWTEFVDRVAHCVGDGVIRHINAEKKKVQDEELDAELTAPTLIARGE